MEIPKNIDSWTPIPPRISWFANGYELRIPEINIFDYILKFHIDKGFYINYFSTKWKRIKLNTTFGDWIYYCFCGILIWKKQNFEQFAAEIPIRVRFLLFNFLSVNRDSSTQFGTNIFHRPFVWWMRLLLGGRNQMSSSCEFVKFIPIDNLNKIALLSAYKLVIF